MARKKKESIDEVVTPMSDDAINPPVEQLSTSSETTNDAIKKNDEEIKNVSKSSKNKPVRMIVESSSSFVNVREKPDGEVLFRIPNHSSLIVDEDLGDWVKVSGYIMKSLVSVS